MSDEYVTLRTTRMDQPGFVEARSLAGLTGGRGRMRGGSVLVERLEGRVPKGRVRDEWNELVQFLVFGEKNHAGLDHPSRRLGVVLNIEHLRDQHETGGQIVIEITLTNGSKRSGLCTVNDITQQAHDAPQRAEVMLLTYDLTIEGGKLTNPSP